MTGCFVPICLTATWMLLSMRCLITTMCRRHCHYIIVKALVLYNHLRQHPHIVYHSQVMDADFEDFIQLLHSTGDVNTRSFLLHTNFDKTYWNYYYSNSGRK